VPTTHLTQGIIDEVRIYNRALSAIEVQDLYSDTGVESFSINNGDSYAYTNAVTLSIAATDSGSGVSEMIISEDVNFVGAEWEPYSASKPFSLSVGSGIKTIFIKFRDTVGNESAVNSDSITFNPDSDGDGIGDITDAFPNDIAASIDTDGDGHPNSWNAGKTQADSTTGLTLDAIPNDPAASVDTDGDGYPDAWNAGKTQADSTTGLTLDAIPNDPAASVDTDGDGYPDAWNAGKTQADTTTGLTLDAIPNDLAASIDTDGDGHPDSWNAGKTQADSTTGLTLDVFPTNALGWMDADGDGIGDTWEIRIFGDLTTATATSDFNLDGTLDLTHFVAETFPGARATEAAREYHSLALKSDGTVVAWGDDYYGQSAIPAGLSGVVSISAGSNHSLALKSDGTVVAWGDNGQGQSTVPANLTGMVSISAGARHSLALKSDGTVVGWGLNAQGQLNIPAGLTGVVSIVAGGYHSLALKSDGTLIAWGYNLYRQSTIPTGLTDVVSLAAGYGHTLALKSDGTVVAWGENTYGQSTIPAGLTGVVSVAAGDVHSLVLKSDGTVVAWGEDYSGQSTIPAGLSDVVSISAGSIHSLALKSDGTVVAWGDNSYGQSTVPAGLVLFGDSDGDGVVDPLDSFPTDPAASVDSDGDGYPDSWNSEATAGQIAASGLVLDGAPSDPSLWADTTPPVIMLTGSASVAIHLNTIYVDAGATALDNVDGNLIGSIVVNDGVNAFAIGSYQVSYNVSDAYGNAATQVVRMVNVVAAGTPLAAAMAGSGAAGAVDGTGLLAQFNQPHGLVVDQSGNIFVADSYSHLIRKIDGAGNVSTMAGSGVAGFADGYATAAQFNEPYGMALDAAGNLYVADSGNHRIRMIDGNGNVTTLAGSGVAGFADGYAAAAQFNLPYGVAIDGVGNLYVADSANHRIRMIDGGSNVTTFAGSGIAGFTNGTAGTAQLNQPGDVTVDSAGNLFVADTLNHAIRNIDATGNVTTLSGTGVAGFVGGSVTIAQFNLPMALASDSYSGLLVADSGNHAIRRVDGAGYVTAVAGTGVAGFTDGIYNSSQFNQPAGVMVDSSGNVVVADTMNHRVRQLSGISGLLSGINNLADGATLTGSSQSFSWPDVGAKGYYLTVGTAPGSSNLFSSSLAEGTTSQLVTGLPVNGIAVYVRLYTWVNDAWQSMDTSYVASGSTFAQISTPTTGATLTASSQLFSWSDTGAASYYLIVGSALGKNDIHSSGVLAAGSSSHSATGLPTNGTTLYVRLYSWVNGAWQAADTTYAASGSVAGISVPANGSTLTATSQTFAWSVSAGEGGYYLTVGAGLGKHDIYNSGWLPAGTSSQNVTGLPANGATLYVRLSSWVNGGWQTTDTTYIASGAVAGISTPTNGTTLAGANQTFSWNVSPGEEGYYLMVGTTVGSSDIYNSGTLAGGTTSQNVTALPTNGSTIYARLYSWVNGSWQTTDSSYVTGP